MLLFNDMYLPMQFYAFLNTISSFTFPVIIFKYLALYKQMAVSVTANPR